MVVVIVVIVVAALALAALGWKLVDRSRRADGVDSFRRQIDALSAEARRSTVDQVKEQSTQHHDPAPSVGVDDVDDVDGSDDGDDAADGGRG